MYWDQNHETMPKKELRQLQLDRLKHTVKHVYDNVPYYRNRMKEMGTKPEDIKTLEDVRKLPTTTKADMREQMPWGLMAVGLDHAVEMHASSGTTGVPITVGYTRHDLNVWSEVMARCLYMAGLRNKDVFQNPIPYGTFTGAFGFHYGAEKVGALVIPSGMGQSERQIQLMQYYGTTFFSGVVSYGLRLGQVALEMGIDPAKDLNVHSGIFGSETFSPELKKKLGDTWGMEVYDIYGLTEMCGPGVSTDCELHDGLHLWEDHFLAEILDPETQEPLSPEEEGELVITTLTKEGMPILRYKTHDITILYDVEECDCGRTHVKHAPIKARSDDMIIISGTNIFPGQIEEVVMKDPLSGTNYQILLERDGARDSLTVLVEARDKLADADATQMAARLQKNLKLALQFSAGVQVLAPGEIKSERIKAQRVVDKRK
ncbi:MAG: phenylacetate--CoA ligase [Candidatus Thermoplasmatota archaeon]|nr:phenylacetate--CoA ligase [Candidatus Thermoplasmatota archaeon]